MTTTAPLIQPALPTEEKPNGQASERASRPLLSLRGITKTYQTGDVVVHALRGIDLDVPTGQMLAIMGASGSGKSTLMNIIGCLDVPTSGQYWLNGQDVGQLDRDELAGLRNHQLGFVFQGFNLLPGTSAYDNVELPLLYAGEMPADARQQRVQAALAAVGLAGREEALPHQLSGGQQQRVAIARALINDPVLILADEPTGNLDTRTSVEVMAILQRLNTERGITVVLVTHEKDIAVFADRMIVFRDGRIVTDAPVPARQTAAEVLTRLPAVES
ncbi:ABC transporter ATP-binding protein [Hymenobacter segetis]|uniref:ABC transporter ATP-binding protein n=1 Tax=Hymenobacter segetis TaxID=2025509 RepID=A0ABU9LWM8_9BACT